MFKIMIISALLAVCTTTDNSDGYTSNYLPYPYVENPAPIPTPAPEGYRPFHIEHYGRHGSRYLIDKEQYTRPLKALEATGRNGLLTPLGDTLLTHLRIAEYEARNRYGELTEKGARQHRAIAGRMAANYPDIFMSPAYINARSTVVNRCILSMLNGIDALRKSNPSLIIVCDASQADMRYMNHEDDSVSDIRRRATRDILHDYNRRHRNKGEYLEKLITDKDFARDSIDAKTLANDLYHVLANDRSHAGRSHRYDTVFSQEERYERWLRSNARWFIQSGNSGLTRNMVPYIQSELLYNIIASADTAIVSGHPGANLRYGHDGMVLPLAVLMELNDYNREINDIEAVGELWHDYEVVPMAANIQLIFYRPDSDCSPENVLVRAMLNEREVTLPIRSDTAPYYKWADIRRYYLEKLSRSPIKQN